VSNFKRKPAKKLCTSRIYSTLILTDIQKPLKSSRRYHSQKQGLNTIFWYWWQILLMQSILQQQRLQKH